MVCGNTFVQLRSVKTNFMYTTKSAVDRVWQLKRYHTIKSNAKYWFTYIP